MQKSHLIIEQKSEPQKRWRAGKKSEIISGLTKLDIEREEKLRKERAKIRFWEKTKYTCPTCNDVYQKPPIEDAYSAPSIRNGSTSALYLRIKVQFLISYDIYWRIILLQIQIILLNWKCNVRILLILKCVVSPVYSNVTIMLYLVAGIGINFFGQLWCKWTLNIRSQ